MTHTNFLAEIKRENVRALLAHHDMGLQELSKVTGINRSRLSTYFGKVVRVHVVPDEVMAKIADVFKIWHGLLNQRDFDPAKTNKPLTSITLTLQLDNLSTAQANSLEKLCKQLGDLA